VKTALTFAFLSILIATLPTAAGHLRTPAAQSGSARLIPDFAMPYFDTLAIAGTVEPADGRIGNDCCGGLRRF
jgi:hypothetical protein